jgi:hypothetical protein
MKPEAQIVKNITNWLIKRIKRRQEEFDANNYRWYGAEERYAAIKSEEAVINELIAVKISLEKYYKKVRDSEDSDL